MRFVAAVLALVCLSSCQAPAWLAKSVPGTMLRWLGFEAPAEVGAGGESGTTLQASAELLHEVFITVLNREPVSQAEFTGYLNVLAQGASLEGIYNGFTHSGDYRKLEEGHKGSSPPALRAFAEELAALEAELPQPTKFNALSAQPLAPPVWPEGVDPNAPPSGAACSPDAEPACDNSDKPAPKLSVAELTDRYITTFAGASIFTLKRVLGEEALKVIAYKGGLPTAKPSHLAAWYAPWVLRLAKRGVDFGVPVRSKSDEAFHLQWAENSPQDRLTWEVLNRLHRLLNRMNQEKG